MAYQLAHASSSQAVAQSPGPSMHAYYSEPLLTSVMELTAPWIDDISFELGDVNNNSDSYEASIAITSGKQ